jgi:hypothetical protein
MKKEDLMLSEDEDDDDINDDIDDQKNSPNGPPVTRTIRMKPKIKLPSIQTRYFNLYDNLSFEILLYMCDNQYTIIPNSYIEYINSKREKLFESVKSSFIKI